MVLGVDPDISGAIAVLRWQNGSGGGRGALPPIESMDLAIHDIPVEIWQLGSRDKRQPSAVALLELLREQALAAAEGGAVVRAVVEYTTPQHLSGKHAWWVAGAGGRDPSLAKGSDSVIIISSGGGSLPLNCLGSALEPSALPHATHPPLFAPPGTASASPSACSTGCWSRRPSPTAASPRASGSARWGW